MQLGSRIKSTHRLFEVTSWPTVTLVKSTSAPMLAMRFVLELAGLVGFGRAAYVEAGWLGAVIAPLLAATVWGLFNVPGDPSRSGKAPIPVRGVVRLALEWTFFFGAATALAVTGSVLFGVVLASATVLLYAVGFDRIRWLIS